jgi:hypothetical protein
MAGDEGQTAALLLPSCLWIVRGSVTAINVYSGLKLKLIA